LDSANSTTSGARLRLGLVGVGRLEQV